MSKWEHLTTKDQFHQVYSRGRSRANNLVVVKLLPNGLAVNRFGFVAGKRLGKAVLRNKAKRWLRESVRPLPAKPGWDIVFIPRQPVASANYHLVRAAVMDLLSRSGVLREHKENETDEEAGSNLDPTLPVHLVAG